MDYRAIYQDKQGQVLLQQEESLISGRCRLFVTVAVGIPPKDTLGGAVTKTRNPGEEAPRTIGEVPTMVTALVLPCRDGRISCQFFKEASGWGTGPISQLAFLQSVMANQRRFCDRGIRFASSSCGPRLITELEPGMSRLERNGMPGGVMRDCARCEVSFCPATPGYPCYIGAETLRDRPIVPADPAGDDAANEGDPFKDGVVLPSPR
jgi:hypothetical protein